MQLRWDTWSDICDFVPKEWFGRGCYVDAEGKETLDASAENRIGLVIKTLESQEFLAQEFDWVIKGTSGEFYACKPDIFENIYEAVD